MVSAIITAAVLARTALEATTVPAMPIRLEWVQQARSLLPFVRATDRPAAYRNYADMLVDVGQCDAAIDVLKGDASFDAESIVSAMGHAAWLGERHCAAELGKLAGLRIESSTSINPLRRATLRMEIGAAIRVDGNDARGAAMIADAEKSLEQNTLEAPMPGAVEALWSGRAASLSTYAGTPVFDPVMTQYGQELAANLSRSKSYLSVPLISGFVIRFAASGRTELVDLIASKLWPSARREVMSSVNMVRDPEISDRLGNKAAPHCVKSVGANGSKRIVPDGQGPFGKIVELSLKSGLAAIDARCAAL
jgi:hypothetical protein